MRERLRRLLDLRNDPRPLVRLAWWGGAAVLMALLISPVPGGDALRLIWGLFNVGLFGHTIVRALARTRGVLRGAAAAFRWAFWGSLVAFLAIIFAASKFLTLISPFVSLPASFASFGLVGALFGAPFVFVGLFLCSLVGAAFGVVNARDKSEQSAAAAAGVARFWLSVMLVILIVAAGRALQFPQVSLWAAPMGLPAFITLMGMRTDAPYPLPWDVGREFGRLLTRWCVVRTKSARRIGYLDLRGPLLGLIAGIVTIALNSLSVLEPLQSAELLQIVRMQSAWLAANDEEKQNPDRIVLLSMDEQVRRHIAKEGSEAKTQAALIRRLKQLGVSRIVLPPPALQVEDAATRFLNLGIVTEPDQPPLRAAATQRAERDLPALVAAMKAAGNVVLALPEGRTPLMGEPSDSPATAAIPKSGEGKKAPDPPSPPPSKPLPPALRQAAVEVGTADLPVFTHPQLPLVPLDGAPFPSIPVALWLSSRGQSATHAEREESLRKLSFPEIRPHRVLVAFPSPRVGVAFPTLDYSTVLAGGEIHQRKLTRGAEMMEDQGTLVSPEVFLRGRIVFLDSVQPAYRESPLGLMPQSELLALATQTLLTRDTIRAIATPWQLVLTLLLPALLGWLCAGRDPFGAGWRVAMAAGILLTTATALGLMERLWLDASAPLLACVGTYLMTTQLTYATNEGDRDLLRRFAAPQVVEELLRRPDMLALGGSRQRLCVLFADVRGFTTFTEQHRDEPERVIETINAYTSAMTEALFQYKGILDKYTGDGLMAFFPVEDNETEAEAVNRSVRAALAMRDTTEVVTARFRAAELQPLHVGIGMHYGEAVVGLVGNLNQFNYTALGYTVVVAARLQTLAHGGEVVVSPEIDGLIRADFETQAMPPVEVKGVSETVTPYLVLRPRSNPLPSEEVPALSAETEGCPAQGPAREILRATTTKSPTDSTAIDG